MGRRRRVDLFSFFELLKGGLWEHPVDLPEEDIDWTSILALSEEQTVVGLVAAGIEHLRGQKPPRSIANEFIRLIYPFEEQNERMTAQVAKQAGILREGGVIAVLLKGQSYARFYQRPQWRQCGDIDWLVQPGNKERALALLRNLPSDSFKVDLQDEFHTRMSRRWDAFFARQQASMFSERLFRLWQIGSTSVLLPSLRYDVVYVFAHLFNHFYKGGIGLRQLCDWCRLLYVNADEIDCKMLAEDLYAIGLMKEWQAFGCFAVKYLGMPVKSMPFYDETLGKKADRIARFIIRVGNFGYNRQMDYLKYPFFIRKSFSMLRRVSDFVQHISIFPKDSVRFLAHFLGEAIPGTIRKYREG